MTHIQSINAYEILDSRGVPTLEVECLLVSGHRGIASVPSGASTGVHEALELRDGDIARYKGQGVLNAIGYVVGEIAETLVGKEWTQDALDRALRALDGTPHKSRLGANAILGVSLAFARAAAAEAGIELYQYIGSLAHNEVYTIPQPMLNVINGGKHADSGLDIQEFMLAPIGFDTYERKIQAGAEIIFALKKILQAKGYATSVGDEGGFAPKLGSNEEAFDAIVAAIEAAGYTTNQVKIAVDVAASSFYVDGMYQLNVGGTSVQKDATGMIAWYQTLVQAYPIISIEDGLAEDDWQGFAALTVALGASVQIVGDDLTVTNVERIRTAIEQQSINSVLIKLNQIGTLTETIDAIMLTTQSGWKPFVSHRSGETIDSFIADLAVGLRCPYIKAGSLVRGERLAKYNRLLMIERIITKK